MCVVTLSSAQANIGNNDLYSFDERRIYNDQDLLDLVSVACELLGKLDTRNIVLVVNWLTNRCSCNF